LQSHAPWDRSTNATILNMGAQVPPQEGKTEGGFAGRTVLAFESRRSAEIAKLIANYGGRPMLAPATKEVPAQNSADLPRFVDALRGGKIDLAIFLTGVGTRALARAVEPYCSRDEFVAWLSRVPVLARGPKPVAALKELGIPIQYTVPEPNTWREILQTLDQNRVPLQKRVVAVQEHGIPSPELLQGLKERGAEILAIHVYDWALPDDLAPLRNAIAALQSQSVDVVLFTAGVQVHHLMQVAEQLNAREPVVAALQGAMVTSIGPVTSEALGEYGIHADLEPTHPKMGFLVKESAEHFWKSHLARI